MSVGFVNLPLDMQRIFQGINDRLERLERSPRFTFPAVASDPTTPRVGDAWLNTTSNQAKIVDRNGTVRVLTWT